MLTATYALEFYEFKSIENRRIIQSWKDKRLRLIEESRHKSLDLHLMNKFFWSAKANLFFVWKSQHYFQKVYWIIALKKRRLRSMTVKNKVYGFEPQLCKCTKTRIIKVWHNAKYAALSGFVKRTCLSLTQDERRMCFHNLRCRNNAVWSFRRLYCDEINT